jgi:hypothetical protein
VVTQERRELVDRTFRARLSWTLLGGLGLLGLTRDLSVGIRGALLAVGIAGFVWLNQPLVAWIRRARADGDARWQPMAIGMALRLVALALVVALAW